MLKYYGNQKLLKKTKIGICGSLYPSKYGIQVTEDFVKKQQKVLVFHDEIGIAQVGISVAINYQKEIIVISKKKRLIPSSMNNKMLVVVVDYQNNNNSKYLEVFEKIINKLTVIELAKTSRLLYMIDNLLDNNVEIYVIPGTIYSKKCSGSNLLIAEGANLLHDELEI